MLRLVWDNSNPTRETWDDLRDNTLVTITLPKEDVTGLWYGLVQLMNANARLAAALNAAQNGDYAGVEKAIDQALIEMTYASTRAKGVYDSVRERAVRTNKRGARRRSDKV
jgi:hypothetical protein